MRYRMGHFLLTIAIRKPLIHLVCGKDLTWQQSQKSLHKLAGLKFPFRMILGDITIVPLHHLLDALVCELVHNA